MKRYMTLVCRGVLLGLSGMTPAAADWSLTCGVHDLIVKDENSHTFGADIGVAGKAATQWGVLMNGSLTAFFNYNKDKLDPDYEPIWYKSDLHMHGDLYPFGSNIQLDWLIRLDGKLNTVSAVEKQIKAFAGVGAHYGTSTMNLGLQTLAGYYFLEIDDDVPTVFGYGPNDFQHETAAYSLLAHSDIKLNPKTKLYTRIQHWRSNHQWLENQYELMVSYDVSEWMEGSSFHVSAEHTRYNLDPYQKALFPPILPWNNDTLVRLYMSVPLG